MHLMCVLYKELPVMDKMMMISHLKLYERSYICLPHM
jgi:hypothetical protein